jgi:hypothetical protein
MHSAEPLEEDTGSGVLSQWTPVLEEVGLKHSGAMFSKNNVGNQSIIRQFGLNSNNHPP